MILDVDGTQWEQDRYDEYFRHSINNPDVGYDIWFHQTYPDIKVVKYWTGSTRFIAQIEIKNEEKAVIFLLENHNDKFKIV